MNAPIQQAPPTTPPQVTLDSWFVKLQTYLNAMIARFAVNPTTGKVTQRCPTASTVGAAGGAAALPATPLGYQVLSINGIDVKIPYYNV